MKNTTHRVVILKNINSALISQAILIVKDSADGGESALIAEAERIVEKYMNEDGTVTPAKKLSQHPGIFFAGAAFLAIALSVIVHLI